MMASQSGPIAARAQPNPTGLLSPRKWASTLAAITRTRARIWTPRPSPEFVSSASERQFFLRLQDRLRQSQPTFPRPLDALAGNAVADQGDTVFAVAHPEAACRSFRPCMAP